MPDGTGSENAAQWQVACLCAAWCRVCDEYRRVFDGLDAHFADRVRFTWIDIEDDEQVLGDLDVADFPTLVISHGQDIAFFGPVLPHAATARHLIERAMAGELPAADVDEAAGLPARIRASRTGAG